MEISITLFPFVLLAIIMVIANLEEHNPVFRWMTYAALAALNLLLVLFGLAGLAMTRGQAAGFSPDMIAAYGILMRALGATGLLAFLPLFRPVRKPLSVILRDFNPDSAVHTTALVYAIYLVGLGLGQQPILSDPDVLGGLDLEITGSLLWAQSLGMIILTLPGVGAFIRRDWRATIERLGLTMPTRADLGVALGATIGLILFQIGVTLAWTALAPDSLAQIEDASDLLLGGFTGLGAALTIGLSAALGEELIFRGALQPRFGLLLTALLFTIVHSQYGFSPATILILAIALVLGFLRDRTSLTVTILIHFLYNFSSVLLPAIGQ